MATKIAIILCLISSSFLFAQETETKPSKMETMNWIGNKFMNYSLTYAWIYENQYGTGATINCFYGHMETGDARYIVIDRSKEGDDPENNWQYQLDLNDVVNYKVETYNDHSCIKLLTHGNKVVRSPKPFTYSNYMRIYINYEAEENLKNRLIRALDVLIIYNRENIPKETF